MKVQFLKSRITQTLNNIVHKNCNASNLQLGTLSVSLFVSTVVLCVFSFFKRSLFSVVKRKTANKGRGMSCMYFLIEFCVL